MPHKHSIKREFLVISLKDALRVFLSIVLILQRLVFLGVGMKYF